MRARRHGLAGEATEHRLRYRKLLQEQDTLTERLEDQVRGGNCHVAASTLTRVAVVGGRIAATIKSGGTPEHPPAAVPASITKKFGSGPEIQTWWEQVRRQASEERLRTRTFEPARRSNAVRTFFERCVEEDHFGP